MAPPRRREGNVVSFSLRRHSRRTNSFESPQGASFGSTAGSVWISVKQGDDWLTLAEHLPPVHAVIFV
jgi:hypothetical protein